MHLQVLVLRKPPASPGREQNNTWASSRGGLPNEFILSYGYELLHILVFFAS